MKKKELLERIIGNYKSIMCLSMGNLHPHTHCEYYYWLLLHREALLASVYNTCVAIAIVFKTSI